jgi:hypothetical protein
MRVPSPRSDREDATKERRAAVAPSLIGSDEHGSVGTTPISSAGGTHNNPRETVLWGKLLDALTEFGINWPVDIGSVFPWLEVRRGATAGRSSVDTSYVSGNRLSRPFFVRSKTPERALGAPTGR